jgi:hypothetical protein
MLTRSFTDTLDRFHKSRSRRDTLEAAFQGPGSPTTVFVAEMNKMPAVAAARPNCSNSGTFPKSVTGMDSNNPCRLQKRTGITSQATPFAVFLT